MHQATLRTVSKDGKSISKALQLDNNVDEILKVITSQKKKGRIKSELETSSVRTLLSTLDDLIHCQGVAEKLIEKG